MNHLLRISLPKIAAVLALTSIFCLVVIAQAQPLSAVQLPTTSRNVDDYLANVGSARVIITFADSSEVETLQRDSARYVPAAARNLSRASEKHPDNRLASTIAGRAVAVQARVAAMGTGMSHARAFRVVNAMVATVDQNALAALRTDPEVKSVVLDIPEALPEPDVVLDIPDKPQLIESPGIIGADTAWAEGYTGAGWNVAVLDTGVRTSHEMFTAKTITEACFSSNTADSTSNCPSGNDVQYGAGAAAPNTNAHGTHCAGIATGDNQNWQDGEPEHGVAPGADLIAIQVFSYFPAYAEEYSWDSDQILALEYVYSLRNSMQIAAVSMSLGGSSHSAACDSDPRASIIGQLRAAGIATVIATGNSNYCSSIDAPACVTNAVAVGPTDKSDNRADYSNFNATLQDVYAPGSSIYAPVITSDSAYGYKSGTSMATPHVAGAFALLRSKTETATVDELETALKVTGTAIPSTTAHCDSSEGTNPRINVDQALDQFVGGSTANPAAAAQGLLLLN